MIQGFYEKLLDSDSEASYRLNDVNKETALRILNDVIKNFNIKSLNFIGSGTYAMAFSIGNGKVFKVTADELELDAASKVIKAKPKHIGRYYKIGYSKTLDLSFIVMKEYKRLNQDDYNEELYEDLVWYSFGNNVDNKIHNITKVVTIEEINTFISSNNLKINNPEIRNVFINCLLKDFNNSNVIDLSIYENEKDIKSLQLFIDCITAIKELKDIDIEWEDAHMTNFAMDEYGRYVVIDLGTADSGEKATGVINFEGLNLKLQDII